MIEAEKKTRPPGQENRCFCSTVHTSSMLLSAKFKTAKILMSKGDYTERGTCELTDLYEARECGCRHLRCEHSPWRYLHIMPTSQVNVNLS